MSGVDIAHAWNDDSVSLPMGGSSSGLGSRDIIGGGVVDGGSQSAASAGRTRTSSIAPHVRLDIVPAAPASRVRKPRSRHLGDDFWFRVLVALIVVTYIIFFTVAVAKMTTIPLEGSSVASAVRRVKAPSITSKGSWFEPVAEMAGGMINRIFHFHWMGLFGRYHGYSTSSLLAARRSAAVMAEERQAAEVARASVAAAEIRAQNSLELDSMHPGEKEFLAPEGDEDSVVAPLGKKNADDPDEEAADGEEEEDLWYVGVLLALFGTMVAAVGNHLVTLAHKMSLDEDSQRNTPRKPPTAVWMRAILPSNTHSRHKVMAYASRPSFMCWFGGNVAITFLGTLLTLMSLALASQSLLAPLSGLTIVWNALLATTRWFGGVTLSRTDIFATLLTLSGCVLIVGGGPRVTKHYQLDELVDMFAERPFQVYSVIAIFAIGYLHALSKQKHNPNRSLASGMMPGIMGGFNNVLAKAAVELVGQLALFESWSSITLLVVWFFVAFFQLSWINHALEQFEPLFIVPVYQATLLLSSTLCGALYYGDFASFSFRQYVTFGAGVLAIIVGVGLLASSSSTPKGNSNDKITTSPAETPNGKADHDYHMNGMRQQQWSRHFASAQGSKRRESFQHYS